MLNSAIFWYFLLIFGLFSVAPTLKNFLPTPLHVASRDLFFEGKGRARTNYGGAKFFYSDENEGVKCLYRYYSYTGTYNNKQALWYCIL